MHMYSFGLVESHTVSEGGRGGFDGVFPEFTIPHHLLIVASLISSHPILLYIYLWFNISSGHTEPNVKIEDGGGTRYCRLVEKSYATEKLIVKGVVDDP